MHRFFVRDWGKQPEMHWEALCSSRIFTALDRKIDVLYGDSILNLFVRDIGHELVDFFFAFFETFIRKSFHFKMYSRFPSFTVISDTNKKNSRMYVRPEYSLISSKRIRNTTLQICQLLRNKSCTLTIVIFSTANESQMIATIFSWSRCNTEHADVCYCPYEHCNSVIHHNMWRGQVQVNTTFTRLPV